MEIGNIDNGKPIKKIFGEEHGWEERESVH